jgi:hypothetical protein
MNESSDRKRLLWLVPVVLVVAVAAAAVVTALRPAPHIDPNTPAGVVQTFFRAAQDSAWDAARAVLGEDLQKQCTPGELARYGSSFGRVVIDRVTPGGTATWVSVEVAKVDPGDPLQRYEERMEFGIEYEGARPVITSLPWQFYCGG